MMSAWRVVLDKEVRENLRDRRALLSALLYGPLVGPVLFAILISFAIAQQQERQDRRIELPVIGQEHAPNLVGFLRQQGVDVIAAPDDPQAAIRRQRHEVILRISPEFGAQWTRGESARVDLLVDGSRQASRVPMARVTGLLNQYASAIATQRLQVRGIDASLMQPIRMVEKDQSTAQSRGATLMAMLPYFLVLSAFIGGMYLAIDTTSGERERQSLEPLMINPVSPAQIMVGKILATTLFAGASLAMCTLAFAVALNFVPADNLGYALNLPLETALWMLALVAPIALLAAAGQTLVASFARSFREAQTYLQILIILPAIPSGMLAFNPGRPEFWMNWVPLFSQSLRITELSRGESMNLVKLLLSALPTFALALFLAWLAIRFFGRERSWIGH